MKAIDAASEAVERGDPTELRRCVTAMMLARDVLDDIELLVNRDAKEARA